MPYTPPQSVGNLVAGGVKLSYTGTLKRPVCTELLPPGMLIPASVTSGATTFADPGVGVSVWNYSEANLASGGLETITFDNVAVIGRDGIAFFNCSSLTSISCPVLTFCLGTVGHGPLPALTTLTMPLLQGMGSNFLANNLPLLTTLSLPELQVLSAFTPNTMALLTTLSIPKLAHTDGSFNPNTMAALTTLSAPLLVSVTGNFAPNTMAALTTFSFPALARIAGTFAPATMGSLTSLAADALQIISGAASVSSMASLTTISLAGMVSYGSTITINSGLGNVTTCTLGTIGTLKSIAGATINISGQKLDAASVNGLLALLVSLDGTNGTTLWGTGKTLTINGGTNAAPSGQGATDKTTLQGRGATITTN